MGKVEYPEHGSIKVSTADDGIIQYDIDNIQLIGVPRMTRFQHFKAIFKRPTRGAMTIDGSDDGIVFMCRIANADKSKPGIIQISVPDEKYSIMVEREFGKAWTCRSGVSVQHTVPNINTLSQILDECVECRKL